MDKQVIWSIKARQELFDILEFWNNHNQSNTYSSHLYQKIQINIKYISENNFIGKSTNISDVRVIVISNYLLFYQVSEKYIEILSLFDSRRNPEDINIK